MVQTFDPKLEFSKSDVQDFLPDKYGQYLTHNMAIEYRLGPGVLKDVRGLAFDQTELKPSDVKDMPQLMRIMGKPLDLNSFYHVLMIDPDNSSRSDPDNRPFVHWLCFNLKPDEASGGLSLTLATPTNLKDQIIDYMGSAPKKGTGLHRYVFMLYESRDRISNFDFAKDHIGQTFNTIQQRSKWNLDTFQSKYGLGMPIALAGYQAQWEPYVDEYYRRLSGA